jgi:predicted hotdog family 3-hydroxylacyl-ACP dehydratase
MLKQQRLDKSWIAQHIPHQGTMCLLDYVESWDAETIVCSTKSHRAINNPLRAYQQLATSCGIEYAAQAMAVHGALLAPADSVRPKSGYLVSVRSTRLYVARLDDIEADLQVEATCIARNDNDVLYQFNVRAQGQLLLDGRAAVVLNVNAPSMSSRNTSGNTL